MLVGTMTTPKKPRGGAGKPAKKPRGPVVFISLDDDTEAALQSFIAAQPVSPDRAAVGLTALRRFLSEHGHFPPKPKH